MIKIRHNTNHWLLLLCLIPLMTGCIFIPKKIPGSNYFEQQVLAPDTQGNEVKLKKTWELKTPFTFAITDVKYSPSGRYLLVVGMGRISTGFMVWDLVKKKKVSEVRYSVYKEQPFTSFWGDMQLAWVTDDIISNVKYGMHDQWSAKTGQWQPGPFHQDIVGLGRPQLSPDGKYYAGSARRNGKDSYIEIYDIATWTLQAKIPKHTDGAQYAACWIQDKLLLAGTYLPEHIYNLKSEGLTLSKDPDGIIITPRSFVMKIVDPFTGTSTPIYVLEMATVRTLRTNPKAAWQTDASAGWMQANPQGTKVVLGSSNINYILDVATHQITRITPQEEVDYSSTYINELAFSADGRYLFAKSVVPFGLLGQDQSKRLAPMKLGDSLIIDLETAKVITRGQWYLDGFSEDSGIDAAPDHKELALPSRNKVHFYTW